MFFRRRKREKESERAEARHALEETRKQSARSKRREEKDQSLFARIEEIRKQNHIAEAVSKLMEGR